MITLVSPRDTRVASTSGNVVLFVKGVPKNVPDTMKHECLAAGCMTLAEFEGLVGRKIDAPQAVTPPAEAPAPSVPPVSAAPVEDETQTDTPLTMMSKKDLVALAAGMGLTLKMNLKHEEMVAAIEAHEVAE